MLGSSPGATRRRAAGQAPAGANAPGHPAYPQAVEARYAAPLRGLFRAGSAERPVPRGGAMVAVDADELELVFCGLNRLLDDPIVGDDLEGAVLALEERLAEAAAFSLRADDPRGAA